MKSKEELYVSVEREVYTSSKADILKSQVNLLNSMKNIEKIKHLKHEEVELKQHLFELFSRLSEKLLSIEEKMPKPKLPKEQQDKISIEKKTVKEIKASYSDSDYNKPQRNIEQELIEIQSKLRELNR
jgi:hypothetical protein